MKSNAPYLLSEVPIGLEFEGSYSEQTIYAHHSKARAVSAAKREERNDGRLERELGVVVLHDRGYVADEPQFPIPVVVVRRLGSVTPIPESCGELLGTFTTEHGRWTWLVFLSRSPAPQIGARERPVSPERKQSPSSRPSSRPAPTASQGQGEPSPASRPPGEGSLW